MSVLIIRCLKDIFLDSNLKKYIQENMFDEKTGFFYDLQINEDGSKTKLLVNRGKGTEGWLPLWAKVATKEQAAAVQTCQ